VTYQGALRASTSGPQRPLSMSAQGAVLFGAVLFGVVFFAVK
jgi:hypothetical protein